MWSVTTVFSPSCRRDLHYNRKSKFLTSDKQEMEQKQPCEQSKGGSCSAGNKVGREPGFASRAEHKLFDVEHPCTSCVQVTRSQSRKDCTKVRTSESKNGAWRSAKLKQAFYSLLWKKMGAFRNWNPRIKLSVFKKPKCYSSLLHDF